MGAPLFVCGGVRIRLKLYEEVTTQKGRGGKASGGPSVQGALQHSSSGALSAHAACHASIAAIACRRCPRVLTGPS